MAWSCPAARLLLCALSVTFLASSCQEDPKEDTGAAPTDDTVTDSDSDEPDPVLEISGLNWTLIVRYPGLVEVGWTQSGSGSVHVEYSFDEGEWLSSPEIDASEGENQQILAGIPYETDAQWRVVPVEGESVEGELFTTGKLPPGLPLGALTVAEEDRWLPSGRYLLASINQDPGGWTGGTYWTFIIDRRGRPVWAHAAPGGHWTLFAQLALGGDHLLWDEATYWMDWDSGAGSLVHRTWLDQEMETVATPGLHHAFVQLPDGGLAWGSQYHASNETLVELGPADKEPRVIWACADDWPGSGYCESNGLYYSQERDSFLYSFYTNNSLVEVDHLSGESLWWAGQVDHGYSFDPSESQFYWQHGVSYTSTGSLLVSSAVREDSSTTAVIEYEVDQDSETLREIWRHDAGVYASTNGDAWRLENGNTLHLVGSASVIQEIDPAGELVWAVEFEGDRLLGRGEFIEDIYALLSPR